MLSAFNRVAASALFTAMLLQAGVNSPGDEPAPADVSSREKRLEFLRSQTDRFQLAMAGQSQRVLQRGKQPILRWSNPVREYVNDGVTYLFFEGERPRAIVTVWVRSRESNLESGELWREFVSLSGEPLSCRRDGAVIWSPKSAETFDQIVPEAPPAAPRSSQRLVQMRELARRFHAATYKTDSANELRLLTQPLYRYPNETAEVLDGALFAFAEGNDPEALLLLEAVPVEQGKRHEWRYTLARSTSYRVVVRLDDREVFAVEPYWKVRRTPGTAYLEANDGSFTLP